MEFGREWLGREGEAATLTQSVYKYWYTCVLYTVELAADTIGTQVTVPTSGVVLYRIDTIRTIESVHI